MRMKNYQVSEELIRQELSLILDFEEIKNSQILSRFIEFVVEKKTGRPRGWNQGIYDSCEGFGKAQRL